MCGIAGLFSKSTSVERALGAHLGSMLEQLADRGPDSCGVAIYRDPAPEASCKVSLFSEDPGFDWKGLEHELQTAFSGRLTMEVRASHALFVLPAEPAEVQQQLEHTHPELRIMSLGRNIEIYKQRGSPRDFVGLFGLSDLGGTHALGHTRMATESRVTTEHSHPFSTGLDLCLVHNGSLSNHNRLRVELKREGIEFQTDNDSEVAAGYLTWRLSQDMDLAEALEAALEDLDGFYTFAIASATGFAVLRDPIACKPAVLAETEDWVAMASEYRALAVLPGAENARQWEPEPGKVYSWDKAAVP